MKKIIQLLLCCSIGCGLVGCGVKPQPFETSQIVETDTVKLEFKAAQLVEEVNPVNQNDEYFYRHLEEHQIFDVQFYVENKTDQEVMITDSIVGKLRLDGEEVFSEVCLEVNHMTELEVDQPLKAHEKTIAHVLYYFDKEEYQNLQSTENPEVTFTIGKQPYTLAIKEIKAKEESIKKNQKLEFEKFNLTVLSASASSFIPALNFEAEDYEYYETDNPEKQYAGSYVLIENKTNTTLNLLKELPGYVGITKKEPMPVWYSVLTKDQSKFEKLETIPANETRTVLVFQEIDLDYEDTYYTFTFVVNGKPYSHTFKHLVIAR